MSVRATEYHDADEEAWDALCAGATAATFLHTRRFLSYHGERFRDRSVLISRDGVIEAVLPAAEDPADPTTVVSHPGASFGGLLGRAGLRGEAVLHALEAAADHFRECGYRRLRYKAVPHIYHSLPAQDDLYALFRLGAVRYRCDLSVAIPLERRGVPSSRRKRGMKAALKAGLTVHEGPEGAAALWRVLTETLASRHGARPVHSLEEILLLKSLFPSQIEFLVARAGDEVVAGVVLFSSPAVGHAQYIASSPRGNELHALDLLFEHAIERSRTRGHCYFDFGISNEQGGQVLNSGLYQFKAEFGGGGSVHEFYELTL